MYFRGSMKRGVSLEVILEEDNKADTRKCHSTKDSSTSSSSGDMEETYEGGDEIDESLERLRTEKKKRKRLKEEYKRKMLMRRSVSCETLTVLDVGKDDSSHDEWEEEAKNWNTNSEDTGSITKTISRRQILQSNRSSSSEDDREKPEDTMDHPIEKKFSISRKDPYEEVEIETSVDLSTEEEPEIQQCFAEETDFLSDGCRRFDEIQAPVNLWLQSPVCNQTDNWITVADLENIQTNPPENHQSNESIPSSTSSVCSHETPESEEQISIEEMEKQSNCMEKEESSPVEGDGQTHHEKLLTVKSAREVFDRPICIGSKASTPSNSSQISSMAPSHVLEHPSVSVIEREQKLPEIRTQTHSHEENDTADEEEEPIIFNSHNKELLAEELPKKHTVLSVLKMFENLPALHREENGREEYLPYVKSNPTSHIIRLDKQHKNRGILSSQTETKSRIISNYRDKMSSKTISNSPKPSYFTSEAPTTICLRKPALSKGFNIQKALLENPRDFHARLEHMTEKPPTKEVLKFRDDRSDGESWSSDSSSDSGVSRDFSSSTIVSSFSSSSKSPTPSWLESGSSSDPSFKWIDPKVLEKIRSVGTTFIYFGPRVGSRSDDGVSMTSKFPYFEGIMRSGTQMSHSNANMGLNNKETEPRVVGVVRKLDYETQGTRINPLDEMNRSTNWHFVERKST